MTAPWLPNRHGVYTQPANGGKALRGADAWEAWSGTGVSYVLDFCEPSSFDSWRHLPFQEWAQVKASGRQLVLGVPMLTGPAKGNPLSLEAGASGEYDVHFQALTHRLLDHGLEDTIIRLGWEMNGGWFPWSARGKEAVFAAYYRRIVDLIRRYDDDGRFRFTWGGNACVHPSLNYDVAYPGDEFVDFVECDAYDQDMSTRYYRDNTPKTPESHAQFWEFLLNGPMGLRDWADFARSHGKPLAVGEWGLTVDLKKGEGGGDNPLYVEGMLDFVRRECVYAGYFEINVPKDRLRRISTPDTPFPLAAEAYRAGIREATSDCALVIDWAEGVNLPSVVAPFTTGREAEAWGGLNVPNGTWRVESLAAPYARSDR